MNPDLEDVVEILSIKLNSKGKVQTTPTLGFKHWSMEETNRYIEAVRMFGKDWKKIHEHVGTRCPGSI